MASGKATHRYRRQARQAAQLQYAPQEAGLRELVRQARSDYLLGARQATAAARGQQAAIRQARPEMGAVYGHAQAELATGQNLLSQDFSKLGAAADPFRGASAREAAAAARRIEQARTAALTELSQQGIDAASGAVYQQQNLRGQYRSDLAKLVRQAQDVEGQKGLAAQKLFSDLIDKADQRALTRRGQNLSHEDRVATRQETHRHNVATERGKGGRGNGHGRSVGLGSLTPTQENQLRDRIGQVVAVIKSAPKVDDAGKPLTDHAMRQHLMNGTSPLKKPVRREIVNIAYDLARLHYLSPANIRSAHNDLGIHIPKSWLPKPVTSLNFGPLGSIKLPPGA